MLIKKSRYGKLGRKEINWRYSVARVKNGIWAKSQTYFNAMARNIYRVYGIGRMQVNAQRTFHDFQTTSALYKMIFGTYHHKVHQSNNVCERIQSKNNTSIDPLQCPIYKSMQINYDFSEDNLLHLYQFDHFKDEYADKTTCKYGQDCKAFVRLENGGYKLDDRCHVKLFRHKSPFLFFCLS
eukprot:755297_1